MLGLGNIRDVFSGTKRNKDGDALIESQSYGQNGLSMESFLGAEESLTEEDILQIPAVQAALELITSSVGQLPIKLYEKSKNGDLNPIDEDYRLKLLNEETNETLTAYNFKKKIARDVILYGASKSYIKKESKTSNTVEAIYPFDTKDLVINVYSNKGYKKYGVVNLINQSGNYTFYDDLLLSVLRDTDNGITGTGIIKNNADTLNLALAQKKYEENLLRNGAMPTSVLETDSKMNDKQVTRLRNSWSTLYEDVKNAGKTIILEQGLKYKVASLNPDNLQLTEGKKSILSDIARMMNIPESMLNASANKYNSNEQNNIYFLQYCLSPLLVSIETALDKSLLLEDEKDNNYTFKFDVSNLLKATVKDQVDTVLKEYNGGIITYQEARRGVGASIDKTDKDFVKLTTGSVMFDIKNNQIINTNTGETMDSEQSTTVIGEKKNKNLNTGVENNDTDKDGDSNTTD